MEDEKPRLQELVEMAQQVTLETKIIKILDIIETHFQYRQVLFFTEYKATQSLLMSSLISKYGDHCVTFINGDNKAENVINQKGFSDSLFESKETAAEKFNDKKVRFLVSTEAGGEGIDLQENCYSLIHVDLPWNPMRLHQRVGRLNRYGQTHPVEVISLRNPDTVETRIWDKLNEKINNIMKSLEQVMDEPEDLLQLVLGMTSPKFFTEIFSEAASNKDKLNKWFDSKTSQLGGKDAIETVKELIGNCEKFDFQQSSERLPKVDLPDLKPFLKTMLTLNKRKIKESSEGISFLTPDNWRNEPAIFKEYQNMHFDRQCENKEQISKMLGVGHKLFNQALKQALEINSNITLISGLESPLFIFQIIDRVTEIKANLKKIIVGVTINKQNIQKSKIYQDWQLIKLLNNCLSQTKHQQLSSPKNTIEVVSQLKESEKFLSENIKSLNLTFQIPTFQVIAILIPRQK